jgi:Fe-S cluster biogenesis protein NfuA
MEVAAYKQELINRVESAIDTIRPFLEADGGNVQVLDITEDGVVELEMMGACGTCPMSPMTLKAGVEDAIMRLVPEIKGIRAINV